MKKKSMSKKIFVNTLFITLVALVAVFALTLGVIYRYFSNEFNDMLRNEAKNLSHIANTIGDESLKTMTSSHRITIISKDGTVLFDNVADISVLDNHLNREEVREAFETGHGSSIRHSKTLSDKTTNEAYLLNNGEVLRVSGTYNSEFSLFRNILIPLTVIAFVAIIISFILARKMSTTITSPINEIDLENPESSHIYEELTPLVDRITAQNKQISEQMQKIQEEHESQDSMRREFTANVSHELKTPLTSISGYAELIENGIAKPEDIERFAKKIHDESARLITLVGDIIKLSQLDEKEVPVTIENIDLYETSSAVLSQLEKSASDNFVSLNLEGEHLIIKGASQIVEEIIFNLCDNAIKYNKPGGHVDVKLSKFADGIELSVSDNGIGISQEDLPHIFERFYRADKSHSKEIGGTGLGLSIVKHGTKFMNAKLTIDSTVGKGTTIKLLF